MYVSYGDMDIPRNRNGEYEFQVIKKHQNTITQVMKKKIIYAKGMPASDIESHFQEFYDIEVSNSNISSKSVAIN